MIGILALVTHLAAAPPPGPVPDFAPLAAVVSSGRLAVRAPKVADALTRLLGPRHVVDLRPTPDFEVPDALLWLRDHQPIFVRAADGGLIALRYRHRSPWRDAWLPPDLPLAEPGESIRREPVEAPTAARREPEGVAALRRAVRNTADGGASAGGAGDFPRGLLETRVVELPLLHEQGNLVTTGGHIFFSVRLVTDNGDQSTLPHLLAGSYLPRDPATVIDLMSHALGRRPADLVLLPPLPGDTTRHVDLMMLPLSPDEVLVPVIEADALALVTRPAERVLSRETAEALETVALTLQRLGYRVVRAPMRAPRYVPSPDEPNAHMPVFFTPANALLLNLGDARFILLPRAPAAALRPTEAALNARHEAAWAAIFAARGWTPVFADVGDLWRLGGLLRCVTATIPAP
ncbi:MAG: hypothetical protein KC620_15995 [Myxococcales bacterium]|nr:hypothetical protein [Myxococcales bacterium]